MPKSLSTTADATADLFHHPPAGGYPHGSHRMPRGQGQEQGGGTPQVRLRVPQARVLFALVPVCAEDPPSEWPTLTRAALASRAGYTPISGTMTRALNGVREGSTSCEAHPGLLSLGYVEGIQVDVDGTLEVNYRVTSAGITAYQEYLTEGGRLPTVRDAAVCTNERYSKARRQG